MTRIKPDYRQNPDHFDLIRVDTRPTYNLLPLIFSAGANRSYDVNVEGSLRYSTTTPPNDPYYTSGSGSQAGQVGDIDGDGLIGWTDNITNHAL